ncbi:hypothetical protein BZG36_01723 [Bifiguratus adelaidae]|uniref:RRM domain-containing protein n=1 Tax=Bifiguratus adelaidae TaxID=1938954 RepID=A0A261Y4N4_9FUNG|nr:hypothetical protein BZG36_01723 [Bifiguratus adelaidae]
MSRRQDYPSAPRSHPEPYGTSSHRSHLSRPRTRSRSPDRHGSRYERDRDGDRYGDRDYGRRQDYRRGRYDRPEMRRPRGPSLPNNNVVLQDIPYSWNEEVIQEALEDLHASFETVRVVKDRSTGQSRGFAFVKFTSVEHARQFIEPNYPIITMKSLRIKIDYSRHEYYDDSARQAVLPPIPSDVNDGARDVGEHPSSLLLVRGLDNLVSEESLYEAVTTLLDASTAALVLRTMVVKDRASSVSCGFGFIECAQPTDATRVLRALVGDKSPATVTIASKPATITYAHQNSLSPTYAPSSHTIMSLDGQVVLAYWDQATWPSVYTPPKDPDEKPDKDAMEDALSAFYADVLTDDTSTNTAFSVDKP